MYDLINERYRYDIGPFTEPEANLIIKQLVLGCKQLYDNKIVHRDLNIKNVLINYPDMEPNAQRL